MEWVVRSIHGIVQAGEMVVKTSASALTRIRVRHVLWAFAVTLCFGMVGLGYGLVSSSSPGWVPPNPARPLHEAYLLPSDIWAEQGVVAAAFTRARRAFLDSQTEGEEESRVEVVAGVDLSAWARSAGSALHAAGETSFAAILAWLHVLGVFALPLVLAYAFLSASAYVALAVAWKGCGGALQSLASRGWILFASQSSVSMALEAGLVVAGLLLFLLTRYVRQARIVPRTLAYGRGIAGSIAGQWQSVRNKVAARSQTAARFLPHALYWGLAGGMLALWPDACYAIGASSLVWILVVYGFPLGLSAAHLVRILHRERAHAALQQGQGRGQEVSPPSYEAQVASRAWLQYWMVHGFVVLLLAAPGSGSLLASGGAYVSFILLALLLWTLAPWTEGASIGVGALLPLLARFAPAASAAPILPIDSVFNVLVLIKLISRETAGWWSAVLGQTSALLLVAPVFFFTPGSITYYGTLLIGTVIPLYCSASALGAWASNKVSTPRRGARGNEEGEALSQHVRFWVLYWSVYSAFCPVHDGISAWGGSWIPFWYHGKLACLLWLQLVGAQQVFQISYAKLSRPVSKTYASLMEVTPLRRGGILATPSTYLLNRVFGSPQKNPQTPQG